MLRFMKFLIFFVRSEIVQISLLTVLLSVLGLVYLSGVGLWNQQLRSDLIRENPSQKDLTVLKQEFVGHNMPTLTVREAITRKQDTASFDSSGILVLLHLNTCVQQQASILRHVQVLSEALSGQVPIRLILLDNVHDERVNRHKALLLRKAVRPNFDIWYTNDTIPLTQTILENQFGVVLFVKSHQVASIFHVGDRGILRSVLESI